MDWESLREILTVAGNTWDGHVTNGSMMAQMDVIRGWLRHRFGPDTDYHDAELVCLKCGQREVDTTPANSVCIPTPPKTPMTFIHEE